LAIPLLVQLGSASQALPIVAVVVVRGRPLPAPHLRIALWCCLLVLFDVADLLIGGSTGNNHWTAYYTIPVEVGMTLWILSAWQPEGPARRAYVLSIAATGTAIAVALLLTDPQQTFDVWVAPLAALVAFAAVLHTLVTRALRSREALGHLDWFWICLGLALFWVVQISTPALMTAFIETHRDLVVRVFLVRSAIMIGAFVCIAWGIVCPRVPSH
jgi:hypothetical protein